jgi:predicted nucleic-acid-binding protein
MIGLDTNVLVRYLMQDDPAQARAAARLIERAADEGAACWIGAIVLCELVWVLESGYEVPKDAIVETLEKIFLTRQFRIEDPDSAWAALEAYRRTGADFSDCLLGRHNSRSGCDYTATFDRALRALPEFRILTEPG